MSFPIRLLALALGLSWSLNLKAQLEPHPALGQVFDAKACGCEFSLQDLEQSPDLVRKAVNLKKIKASFTVNKSENTAGAYAVQIGESAKDKATFPRSAINIVRNLRDKKGSFKADIETEFQSIAEVVEAKDKDAAALFMACRFARHMHNYLLYYPAEAPTSHRALYERLGNLGLNENLLVETDTQEGQTPPPAPVRTESLPNQNNPAPQPPASSGSGAGNFFLGSLLLLSLSLNVFGFMFWRKIKDRQVPRFDPVEPAMTESQEPSLREQELNQLVKRQQALIEELKAEDKRLRLLVHKTLAEAEAIKAEAENLKLRLKGLGQEAPPIETSENIPTQLVPPVALDLETKPEMPELKEKEGEALEPEQEEELEPQIKDEEDLLLEAELDAFKVEPEEEEEILEPESEVEEGEDEELEVEPETEEEPLPQNPLPLQGGPQRFYLYAPTGAGVFYSNSLRPEPDTESIYELILAHPQAEEGSLRLLQQPKVLARVEAMPQQLLLPVCELQGRGPMRPESLEQQSGLLRRDGAGWRIAQKILLSW